MQFHTISFLLAISHNIATMPPIEQIYGFKPTTEQGHVEMKCVKENNKTNHKEHN